MPASAGPWTSTQLRDSNPWPSLLAHRGGTSTARGRKARNFSEKHPMAWADVQNREHLQRPLYWTLSACLGPLPSDSDQRSAEFLPSSGLKAVELTVLPRPGSERATPCPCTLYAPAFARSCESTRWPVETPLWTTPPACCPVSRLAGFPPEYFGKRCGTLQGSPLRASSAFPCLAFPAINAPAS